MAGGRGPSKSLETAFNPPGQPPIKWFRRVPVDFRIDVLLHQNRSEVARQPFLLSTAEGTLDKEKLGRILPRAAELLRGTAGKKQPDSLAPWTRRSWVGFFRVRRTTTRRGEGAAGQFRNSKAVLSRPIAGDGRGK